MSNCADVDALTIIAARGKSFSAGIVSPIRPKRICEIPVATRAKNSAQDAIFAAWSTTLWGRGAFEPENCEHKHATAR